MVNHMTNIKSDGFINNLPAPNLSSDMTDAKELDRVSFDLNKLFPQSNAPAISRKTIFERLTLSAPHITKKQLKRKFSLAKKEKDFAYQALFFALLSHWVYLDFKADAKKLKDKLKSVHLGDYQTIDIEDTQVLIINLTEHILVIFRGTSSIKDWLTDANTDKVIAPIAGKIHHGISMALDKAWDALTITIHIFGNKPLIIAGHSLGGGLSQAMAMKAVEKQMRVYAMFTYGGMRVGDWFYINKLNSLLQENFQRWVNANDVVPRLLFLRYSHGGKLYYIDVHGIIHQDLGVCFKFWDHLQGFVKGILKKEISYIEDHSILRYIHHTRLYLEKLRLTTRALQKKLTIL